MIQNVIFKYSFIFAKQGDMIYISHLDVMDVFRRAMRRASLPFVVTKGFTPRVKISMPKALKLGEESLCEEITLFFSRRMSHLDVREKINRQLPEGLRITGKL